MNVSLFLAVSNFLKEASVIYFVVPSGQVIRIDAKWTELAFDSESGPESHLSTVCFCTYAIMGTVLSALEAFISSAAQLTSKSRLMSRCSTHLLYIMHIDEFGHGTDCLVRLFHWKVVGFRR